MTSLAELVPDIKISVNQIFGIDTDMKVDGFSKKNEYVPKIDNDYKFDRDDKDKISVKDCQDQLDKWAEAQAKQLAEKTPQGQRLSFLKAVKERMKDMVKEASVPSELKEQLSGLMKLAGVSWDTKLPALPPPKSK